MPLYEYRCTACQRISEAVRSVKQSGEPAACVYCGASAKRIVSRPAVHLSKMSKVEKLDPKYDKMVDKAMQNTASADPDRYIR